VQSRGSAITDPRQWLPMIVNKWLEMRWWHF
jgi:hypothetical protein